MKVSIIGAGAIGGNIAKKLVKAGLKLVSLIPEENQLWKNSQEK